MTATTHKELEVYSATKFSDLIASPAFYAIAIITLVLGFSSIFGFLQSPKKLKGVIDAIAKKVAIYDQSSNKSVQGNYSLSNSLNHLSANKQGNINNNTISFIDTDRYNIFSEDFFVQINEQYLAGTIQLASFDYDITSEHFWGDLDMTRIESIIEESQRKDAGIIMIGTPLKSEFLPLSGDSKYSMKVGNQFRI